MNIIVTGASSGIGYQTALNFAKEKKHKVIAVARDLGKLQELKQESMEYNPNSHLFPLQFDIGKDHDSDRLISLVKKELTTVDILINNAGMLVNKPFAELTDEDFLAVYQVNVFGVAKTIQTLLPYMGNPHTHVVNIGSVGGITGSVKFAGLSAYSSSKGALAILTECLAEEYKDKHISFNYLALGSVQTEMFSAAFPKFKAQSKPQEMAKFITEFAHNGHLVMNGKVIPVSKSNP